MDGDKSGSEDSAIGHVRKIMVFYIFNKLALLSLRADFRSKALVCVGIAAQTVRQSIDC
ncbi:hypothetical protein [Photobacterium proteolyticum]|uniref:hypothetical protein n=1 Tax=Photobacterium proteolyticum TaxID=1903952 RepID=UPI000AA81088|nr:hypothetical protein [Photobacterium proteolyticum]